MLEEKFLQQAEKELKKEEAKLISELSKVADRESDGDYSARYVDLGDEEDDNVQEYRDYDLNIGLVSQLENQLADVRRALEKIKKGTYGSCDKCKGEISQRRLEAYPPALYCIKCADER